MAELRNLVVSGNANISGTLSVGGNTTLNTLTVSNATTLSSTLNVGGATTLSSTLNVGGATTLSSTLGVSGATTLSSTLGVSGATTLGNTLSVNGITTLNKTLMINAPAGSYVEGIRIKPSTGNWSTILLGGADMPANEGTSENSWGLFNHNGDFYISRNGSSSSSSAILSCVSNQWSISNLSVSGESSFNGNLDIQSHQVIGSNGGSWISSRDRAIIKNTSHGQAAGDSYNPIVSIKTSSGEWSIGNLSGNEALYFSYTNDADYNKSNNNHVDFTISKDGVYSGTASSANYASSAGSAGTATTAYNIPTWQAGNIWIS